MTRSLRVILWDDEIGRLAWDERRRLAYFMYNPEWVKKGLNISPLVAPVDEPRGLAPVWGEDAKIYHTIGQAFIYWQTGNGRIGVPARILSRPQGRED